MTKQRVDPACSGDPYAEILAKAESVFTAMTNHPDYLQPFPDTLMEFKTAIDNYKEAFEAASDSDHEKVFLRDQAKEELEHILNYLSILTVLSAPKNPPWINKQQ